ncbi:MAG: phosphate ABC transporter permease subunit PstC [Planctomycetales bacterium]|nr:phosphate ABC transporter permease subunit PstC [Planctomycetales bacterium]MCA9169213.1 phosphate ABC transporter permease subunit PstC [Planctomycetales bacterium]
MASELNVGEPQGSRRKSASLGQFMQVLADITEPTVELAIRFCGWSAILFVLAIFFFVFREAFPILRGFDFHEFFTSAKWRPDSQIRPTYGILALLAGTGAVTVGSMLLAVPIGLGAAVYISEFCTGRRKEVLKITIELLAAIPSIVWGFIGVVALGPVLLYIKETFGFAGPPMGLNVLNASLILALMSVPVIVSVGEDALKAVPDSYREAALALGASRWEIVYRVLFPAAKNGLLAAVLLGVGRAIGETMAVLMCTGHAVQIPKRLFDPARTLTATIAAELGEAESGGNHYRVLFLIGVVLFAVTFLVNLLADVAVKGIRGSDK